MWPAKTVMDLASIFLNIQNYSQPIQLQSLAMALYFASRGVGHIKHYPDGDPKEYTTPARVLLNGLGSDELLGGYGRHRAAFANGGWQAVIDEVWIAQIFSIRVLTKVFLKLQLELDRLPVRNLGRDDRIISSHGKETRHPFLSLSVVNFVANLPVHHKVEPRLDLGFGDKILLRFASRKLGLVEASERKKKAMQFGSHSARMGGEKFGDALL